MSVKKRSLAEVRQAGLEILARELGPADYVRFIQQFEAGQGDYTEERQQWLGDLDGETLIEELRRFRAERATAKKVEESAGRREPEGASATVGE